MFVETFKRIDMENVFIPKPTKTVNPPIEHRRFTPNFTQITDFDRKKFFTNFNKDLVDQLRTLKLATS